MTGLKISTIQIPETGLRLDTVVEPGALKPAEAKDLDVSAIRVSGKLTTVGDEILFQGRLAGAYRGPCSRCLRPVEVPFDLDVLWAFVARPDVRSGESRWNEEGALPEDDEIDVHSFVGDEIDLAPCVWEEVVLGMPSRFIPEADDAGQCVVCGDNLAEPLVWRQEERNETETKGLAGLADMFPELRPKKSEE